MISNLENNNLDSISPNLLSDQQVASLLSFSVAWVRKERWKRKTGKPHLLDIDPVIIGNTPRYREIDIYNWINEKRKNMNGTSECSVRKIEVK